MGDYTVWLRNRKRLKEDGLGLTSRVGKVTLHNEKATTTNNNLSVVLPSNPSHAQFT